MFLSKPPFQSVISRAQLFRELLKLPRPTYPIEFHFAGVEHGKLAVQALSADEWHSIAESSNKESEYARSTYIISCVIAKTLTHGGKLVFGSHEPVLRLVELELQELSTQVANALSIISPIIGVSDYELWKTALCEGARDITNFTAAKLLGDSYMLVDGPKINPRIICKPEEYFGVPKRDLLDCHYMAYQAARAICEERLK